MLVNIHAGIRTVHDMLVNHAGICTVHDMLVNVYHAGIRTVHDMLVNVYHVYYRIHTRSVHYTRNEKCNLVQGI